MAIFADLKFYSCFPSLSFSLFTSFPPTFSTLSSVTPSWPWLKEKVRILPVQNLRNCSYYSQEMCRISLAICSYSIFSGLHRKIFFDSTLTQGRESSLTACLFSQMNQRVYEPSHIFCSDVCFLLHLLKSCELFLQNLFERKKKNEQNQPTLQEWGM